MRRNVALILVALLTAGGLMLAFAGEQEAEPEQTYSVEPVSSMMPFINPLHYQDPDVPNAPPETVLPGGELEIEVEEFTSRVGFSGWRITVPGGRPLATPAFGDGLIYVGGGFGSFEFYAFDALTGAAAWMFKSADDGPTAAVYSQGRVAFNTESCILYVLDAATGEMVWQEWLGDPLMAQPAISGDKLLITYPSYESHFITARHLESGQEYWKTPIIGEVMSAPIIVGEDVYFTCLEGTVYRLSLSRGDVLFSEQMRATSAPWIYNGDIYVSRREDLDETDEYGQLTDEGLARLSGTTGEQLNAELWQRRRADYLRHGYNQAQEYYGALSLADEAVGFPTAPEVARLEQAKSNIGLSQVAGVWAYQGSRPLVMNGLSYTAKGDSIICLRLADGVELFEFVHQPAGERIGGRMLTPPSFADNKLVIGTEDGFILCLDALDGGLLWSVEIGEPVRFQPALWKGWVFVGTDSGSLIGFDTGNPALTGWTMWGGGAGHNG